MSALRSKRALQRAIERDKKQLQAGFDHLGACVKREIDPRVRVARNPYAAVAVAFALGVTCGLLQPPMR